MSSKPASETSAVAIPRGTHTIERRQKRGLHANQAVLEAPPPMLDGERDRAVGNAGIQPMRDGAHHLVRVADAAATPIEHIVLIVVACHLRASLGHPQRLGDGQPHVAAWRRNGNKCVEEIEENCSGTRRDHDASYHRRRH
jgi:hypothetical protein